MPPGSNSFEMVGRDLHRESHYPHLLNLNKFSNHLHPQIEREALDRPFSFLCPFTLVWSQPPQWAKSLLTTLGRAGGQTGPETGRAEGVRASLYRGDVAEWKPGLHVKAHPNQPATEAAELLSGVKEQVNYPPDDRHVLDAKLIFLYVKKGQRRRENIYKPLT